MADRFYNDIELPDLVDTSGLAAPDNGFIQVYGKGGKLAYMDSTGVETVVDMTVLKIDMTVLKIDNGNANTQFNDYVLRMDFGKNGANI